MLPGNREAVICGAGGADCFVVAHGAGGPRRRPVVTERVARSCASRPWWVLGGWVLAVAASVVLIAGFLGTRSPTPPR